MFFLSFFLILHAFAESPCLQLKNQEIAVVKMGSTSLVACAEKAKGVVSDLTIFYVETGHEKSIFEGDSAFKQYRVYSSQNDIMVEEGFNTKDFKPFLLKKTICKKKACILEDVKCLWKKTSTSTRAVSKIKAIKSKKQSVSDSLWDELMFEVLNGSKEALAQFREPIDGLDTSGVEAFNTYLEDLPRLRKVGCL